MMYPIPFSLYEKAGDTRPQVHHKGFTLVEILIVIVIIGILAGSLLLIMGTARDSAEAARIISEMRTMKSAAVLYKSDQGNWPLWAYNFGSEKYENYDPDGSGALPDDFTDRIPVNEDYWIGVMYGPDDSGKEQAFVILYDQGLRKGVKEVLASRAVEMGFMAKLSQNRDFSDLHVFTSDDNNLMWFLTGS